MRRNTIDIITLGCSKNLVDSEKLMRQLEANGYKVTHDSPNPQGEIAVINTCGFIGDAKEESINMILEFCEAKEEGRLNKLYVMGCLSERYLKELEVEIPQVDKFYGKFNWNELLTDLGKAYHDEIAIERTLTTPKHYAYLKISEGCDRSCAYCAIPIITGKHTSRPMEEIIDEVKLLVSEGVKEFQIIAQELTYYGVDLYKSQKLPELIERIAQVPGVEWIRLHYAYPTHFPEDLFNIRRHTPGTVYSVTYFDAEQDYFYVKRFLGELSDKPMSFIDENPNSYMVEFNDDRFPQLEVVYGGKYSTRPTELIDVEEFIGVKGVKAKGKRVTTYETTSIRFVEPLEKEILEELTQESFIPEGVAVEEIAEEEHDMVQQELF
jgi:hypothetical protein